MRYEIKFVINSDELQNIISTINYKFFSIKKLYPDRIINSIYYDDINFNCYFDHVNGVSNRYKSRVRWYNNDLSKLTLEKKIKSGRFNYKEHKYLNQGFFNEPLRNYYKLFNFLPIPTLENCYKRSYFYVKDFDKIRVTFDTLLISSHPLKNVKYYSKKTIIEFKAELDQKNNLNELIRRIPMKYTKNSKYVSGIRMIYN